LVSWFLGRWEGEKEINNREEFLMQVFKRWKDINIILFLSQGSSCKFDLSLPNELCQAVGDNVFLLDMSF
jgi:hypothetical protein